MEIQQTHSYRALTLATLAFAACFSVWTLYSIIGIELKASLHLTATEFGLLLAAPIFTGAIFRVPIGFIAERVSCRNLLFWQMLIVIPPLFYLPYVETFTEYVLLGFVLGLSGVSFTIGIRYVTDWFDTKRQGFALGVFGAGNAGAAITLVLVPFIVEYYGWQSIGPIYGFGLLAMAIIFRLFAPEVSKFYQEKNNHDLAFHLAPLKDLQVWRFGLYYYFVFGGFVALALWLPKYYLNEYNLDLKTASLITMIFTLPSGLVRALGGYVADKKGARVVNWWVFWVSMICLFFLSYPQTSLTIFGIDGPIKVDIGLNVWVFTALVFIVGIAQGFGKASVYRLLHDYYPDNMGSVGGMVGVLGGLGGFSLPIFFGIASDLIGVRSSCFMLLFGLVAACMLLMNYSIVKQKNTSEIL